MKINYNKILNKNMINVFRDVLLNIETNGLQGGHHLYITFNTNNLKVKIPDWLKKKYPEEMTIVIQYEYWNFKVSKNSFNIALSFNDVKTDLNIDFQSIISFADPYANFGLKLSPNIDSNSRKNNNKKKQNIKKEIKTFKNNVINFKNYKKN